jgi:hypothetical protein
MLGWTGSYLSLPSKTVTASGNTWDWEVGTNLPLSRQGSNFLVILSSVDIVGIRTRLTWGFGEWFTRAAVNVPRYIMSCRLAVVFAWGERTAAPRSLTLLLHAVLNSHIKLPFRESYVTVRMVFFCCLNL